MRTRKMGAIAVALGTVLAAGTASAAVFQATLLELNGSGVSGTATLDLQGSSLLVELELTGLLPDMVHAQHIHGLTEADGTSIPSTVPPSSADADDDGALEVGEGVPFYGPVLLPLVDAGGSFPTAPSDGMLSFMQTYDISGIEGLLPLRDRVVVIHGLNVGPGVDAGLPDGGYLGSLPVAAAEIAPIPLPAAAAFLLSGLAGLGALSRRRS